MHRRVMTTDARHRIDKFTVPSDSMDEFLTQVRHIHRLFDDQPGLLRNDITVLADGPSGFNVATVVSWESQDALERAGRVVGEDARARGFDRAQFMATLGVIGDFGTYAGL